MPSEHMQGIILFNVFAPQECARVSFVNWHHVFIEFAPQALVWLKTTTQQQMSTQNAKKYKCFFFMQENRTSKKILF